VSSEQGLETVDLIVEVMGCPTICHHCWVLGTPYPAMAGSEVEWTLDSVHGWCDQSGIRFGAFPMHEVAAHPQAAELIRLFARHDWVEAPFEPLSTTGVPLAQRDDWAQVLAAAAETGTTTAWVAFHGFEEEHDRMVGRRGAFEETCRGVERIHAAGLEAGCNVFVTSANMGQIPELAVVLSKLGLEQECWQPAAFYPQARSRRYERLRVGLDQIQPWAGEIGLRSLFYKEHWANLSRWTEGELVRRALASEWDAVTYDPLTTHLVCRPNLDVHFGRAGLHGEPYGNLRRDGVETVMRRAIGARGRSLDAIWFDLEKLPSLADLASRAGDLQGQGIHFDGESVRYLWLDRMLRPRSRSSGAA
jgi:hypothetical protein